MDSLYYTPEDADENDELVEDLDGLSVVDEFDLFLYTDDEED